jgi:hypothetical protein
MTASAEFKKVAFPAIQAHGQRIEPFIHLLEVKGHKNARLSYAGHSADHLKQLKEQNVFQKLGKISYAGDVFANLHLSPRYWFFEKNTTKDLFLGEIDRHQKSEPELIISSNAGNAPLHDHEVNFSRQQTGAPLAAKDWEVPAWPLPWRKYYCVSYSVNRGLELGYQRFSGQGLPLDSSIETAVGGRPLVHRGKAVSLTEVLTTSITDPRHVLLLPEVYLRNNICLPFGLRTVQQMIRDGRTAELLHEKTSLIKDEERKCCGALTDQQIMQAFLDFGYRPEDLALSGNSLAVKLALNPYRHTFWAQTDDALLIGIINNDLDRRPEKDRDKYLHDRILKPTGLTIPQLQTYLAKELKAKEAVLLGNGKDCRIFCSKRPHEIAAVDIRHDNDVIKDDLTAAGTINPESKRAAVTAGLLTLIV